MNNKLKLLIKNSIGGGLTLLEKKFSTKPKANNSAADGRLKPPASNSFLTGQARIIIISLFATLACVGIIKAATTIGNNISTDGTITGSGVNTLYGATSIGGALTATSTLTVTGLSIFDSNVGIGTSSPYAKLSVVGEIVGSYFTATSTTATSTFLKIAITDGSMSGVDLTGQSMEGMSGGAVQGDVNITGDLAMTGNAQAGAVFVEAGTPLIFSLTANDHHSGVMSLVTNENFGGVADSTRGIQSYVERNATGETTGTTQQAFYGMYWLGSTGYVTNATVPPAGAFFEFNSASSGLTAWASGMEGKAGESSTGGITNAAAVMALTNATLGGGVGITNNYGFYGKAQTAGTSINAGLWLEPASGAANNYGIVLDGSTLGSGIVFGESQEAWLYFDGGSLNVNYPIYNMITKSDMGAVYDVITNIITDATTRPNIDFIENTYTYTGASGTAGAQNIVGFKNVFSVNSTTSTQPIDSILGLQNSFSFIMTDDLTVTDMYGQRAVLSTAAASGNDLTITNYYGSATSFSDGGAGLYNGTNLYHYYAGAVPDYGGTLTNHVGLYVADIIYGVNKAGIVIADGADGIYFGGMSGQKVTGDADYLTFTDAIRIPPQASPPIACAAGTAGVIYVDTTNNELCMCDGTIWQGVSTQTDANCS